MLCHPLKNKNQTYQRDRNSERGGKLVFVKNGLIAKRVKDLETNLSGTICIELTRKSGEKVVYSISL